MRESFQSYCERMELSALLEQWDTQRNSPLMPEQISYGSKQKVWWRCSKGHIWQAPPYARTGSETGCPYCAGKLPVVGESDLKTRYPMVAAQWHPTKNGALTPEQVLPGSHQKVWWRCEKGHEWQAQVKSRVHGSGCPLCANKVVEPADIIKARKVVREVYMDEKIERYIVDIVYATRTPADYGLSDLAGFISFGASPRASISLSMAAKAYAFIKRRGYVIPEDVRAVCPEVLRHRIGLTYEAEAENVVTENIIERIINAVIVP